MGKPFCASLRVLARLQLFGSLIINNGTCEQRREHEVHHMRCEPVSWIVRSITARRFTPSKRRSRVALIPQVNRSSIQLAECDVDKNCRWRCRRSQIRRGPNRAWRTAHQSSQARMRSKKMTTSDALRRKKSTAPFWNTFEQSNLNDIHNAYLPFLFVHRHRIQRRPLR